MKFYDNGQLMLFDLDKDLSEKIDLSSINLNKTLELELLLDNYLKQVEFCHGLQILILQKLF